MDLILGPFADQRLAALGADDLELYETLLNENDQDLYQWVSGQATPPARLCDIIEIVRQHSLGG